jgi:hypothetical protein
LHYLHRGTELFYMYLNTPLHRDKRHAIRIGGVVSVKVGVSFANGGVATLIGVPLERVGFCFILC